jgi:hypothetical protein
MRLPTMLPFGLTSICNVVSGVRSEATKRFLWESVTSHTISDSELFASRLTSTCTGARRGDFVRFHQYLAPRPMM